MLIGFESGLHVDHPFNAVQYTPIYLEHLLTLAETYKTPYAKEQLVHYLQKVADDLRYAFLQR